MSHSSPVLLPKHVCEHSRSWRAMQQVGLGIRQDLSLNFKLCSSLEVHAGEWVTKRAGRLVHTPLSALTVIVKYYKLAWSRLTMIVFTIKAHSDQ